MHLTYELYEIITHWMVLMCFFLLGHVSNVRKVANQLQETITYMELYKEQLLVEKETLKEKQELILDLKNYQDLNNRLQHGLFEANKHRGK